MRQKAIEEYYESQILIYVTFLGEINFLVVGGGGKVLEKNLDTG